MTGSEREPEWLRAEIDRAAGRAEKVPAWARPVLIDRRWAASPAEAEADTGPDQGT